jgi:hypothetical protein
MGGGAFGSTLDNCTLTGNSASMDGGGASGGTLNNCTLTGNSANFGGGASGGTLNNCIVWNNVALEGNDYSSIGSIRYSCTAPLPEGEGNISEDPRFTDADNGDFRLRAGSPCINAGTNELVVGSVDLDGNPRIYNGRVEMGAYEFMMTQNSSVPIPFSWLNLFYSGLSGSNAYEVAASVTGPNSHPVWESYVAGLNPTNPLSRFIASIIISNDAHLVTWTPDLRPDRIYTILGKTNLTDTVWGPTNAASRFFKVNVEMP